ncbi:MAG: AAA family ATPase [Candidatus Hydrogenedentes bacterium]|nr:AAA family ATPase [Candidatus Hydrogenedentota bacterium]
MDHTHELIEQLRKPDFYPHATEPSIRIVQTHISIIALTGTFAYKIKKPVNLGFLDFSSLEKRKYYCEEELRLNTIFAPDLYIDVLPLYRNGNTFSFSPDGPDSRPVEYVLKMHEFDSENVLLDVFNRGELTPAHIREIASKLAGLHAQARSDEAISEYGTPESIASMFRDEIERSAPFVGRTQTREWHDETKAYAESFLQRNASLFQRRVGEKKIRECHGDLHLNNICIYKGNIEFFDRIEFSDTFKNIDVMYDLAFLLMDLEYRGHPDFANILLNTYLELSGDYEGAILLPLYKSMRAHVRGSVISLLIDDPEIGAREKATARADAHAYFAHAWRYTRPRSVRLIAMSGLSGSGKSVVARELAQRTGAVVIRSDAIRKHLAGVALDEHGRDLYSPEMTRQTYEELIRLGIELGTAGLNVILDATFGKRIHRNQLIDRSREIGIPLTFLHCVAPEEVLRERLKNRTDDISDATHGLLDTQQKNAEPFSDDDRQYLTTLNTDAPIDYDELARRFGQVVKP